MEEGRALARRGSRVDEPAAYHAEGILYLPAEARFDYLLNRPEAENIGAKVNAAMRDIEKNNPQLAGVLPKTYNLFTSTLLKELLKKVSEIPTSLDYDALEESANLPATEIIAADLEAALEQFATIAEDLKG